VEVLLMPHQRLFGGRNILVQVGWNSARLFFFFFFLIV
jgi:hypothetical protein